MKTVTVVCPALIVIAVIVVMSTALQRFVE
jgi:hypothetical protein